MQETFMLAPTFFLGPAPSSVITESPLVLPS